MAFDPRRQPILFWLAVVDCCGAEHLRKWNEDWNILIFEEVMPALGTRRAFIISIKSVGAEIKGQRLPETLAFIQQCDG
jgi:hypothetical protein